MNRGVRSWSESAVYLVLASLLIATVPMTVSAPPRMGSATDPMRDVHYDLRKVYTDSVASSNGILQASMAVNVAKFDRDGPGPGSGQDEVRLSIAATAHSRGANAYSLEQTVPWAAPGNGFWPPIQGGDIHCSHVKAYNGFSFPLNKPWKEIKIYDDITKNCESLFGGAPTDAIMHYGNLYHTIYVHEDGFVTLFKPPVDNYRPRLTSLPSKVQPDGIIAPFWQDMWFGQNAQEIMVYTYFNRRDSDWDGGLNFGVKWKLHSLSGVQEFAVQWNCWGCDRIITLGNYYFWTYTYFLYWGVYGGASARRGLEDEGGTRGLMTPTPPAGLEDTRERYRDTSGYASRRVPIITNVKYDIFKIRGYDAAGNPLTDTNALLDYQGSSVAGINVERLVPHTQETFPSLLEGTYEFALNGITLGDFDPVLDGYTYGKFLRDWQNKVYVAQMHGGPNEQKVSAGYADLYIAAQSKTKQWYNPEWCYSFELNAVHPYREDLGQARCARDTSFAAHVIWTLDDVLGAPDYSDTDWSQIRDHQVRVQIRIDYMYPNDVCSGCTISGYVYMTVIVDWLKPMAQRVDGLALHSRGGTWIVIRWNAYPYTDFKGYDIYWRLAGGDEISFVTTYLHRGITQQQFLGLRTNTCYDFLVSNSVQLGNVCTLAEDPPPGGGTPYVAVWNGSSFVNDNNLLTESHAEVRGPFNVTDSYVLTQSPVPQGGTVKYRIHEPEDEITLLDRAGLEALFHSSSLVAVARPDGSIYSFPTVSAIPASSALQSLGPDRTSLLASADGISWQARAGDVVTLTWNTPLDLTGGAHIVYRCGCDKLGNPPFPDSLSSRPSSGDRYGSIQVRAANGSLWKASKAFEIPRADAGWHAFNITDIITPPPAQLKVELSMLSRHPIDFIGVYTPLTQLTGRQFATFLSASHSALGNVTNALRFEDSTFVRIGQNEYVDLTFADISAPPGSVRSWRVDAVGHFITDAALLDLFQDVVVTVTATGAASHHFMVSTFEDVFRYGGRDNGQARVDAMPAGNSTQFSFRDYASRSNELAISHLGDGLSTVTLSIRLQFSGLITYINRTYNSGVRHLEIADLNATFAQILYETSGAVFGKAGVNLGLHTINLPVNGAVVGWNWVNWTFGDSASCTATCPEIVYHIYSGTGVRTPTATARFEDGLEISDSLQFTLFA